MEKDTLIKVEGLSKKFSRNLKRTMLYGSIDLARSLVGHPKQNTDLRKDEFWALQDINFELKRGEILGLIGRNGCGKSTLLRLLTGVYPPDRGRITMKGRIGALIAVGAGFHPHMTGRENIYLNGTIIGMKRSEIKKRFEEIVEFAEIGKFIDAPVSTYSSGMHVRLGFSIAAHIEPDILLIDEVLSVGDLGFRVKAMNLMQKLLSKTAVIFVSHAMLQVSTVCNRIVLMEDGGISHIGNNVGEGIEKYYTKFEVEQSQIIGQNQVVLETVALHTKYPLQNNKYYLDSGENLKIKLVLKVMDENIKSVKIRIGIFNKEARLVAEADSDIKSFDVDNNGQITVNAEIKSLYLRYGEYNIHLHVTNSDTKEKILRQSSIATFIVKQTLTVGADFLLPAEWQ